MCDFRHALVLSIRAVLLVVTTAGSALADPPERGVPYFTIRDRTGDSAPKRFYGEARSDLKAGFCGIGQIELRALTPIREAAPFRVPDEILRVENLREGPSSGLLDALEISADGRPPLLYTHGFHIDFEKGCRRATLLQENAGQEGRFLWFSWPSDGSLFNYTHDEADLYWSVPDLAATIARMADRFGATPVNLAGHSLGGRGMILALYELAYSRPDLRLGDLVLLAPDMDFDIFRKMLPRIRPLVRGITVYVAQGDRPLGLSEEVHGYPRLGQSGNDVASLVGVEVIDVSDLPMMSPTGHLYHIYNPDVGADIEQLLNEGKRAGARRALLRDGPNLWRLQRAE